MSVGDLAGSAASGRAAATVPSRWLFHESSGRFWPVTEFHRWIDRHRTHPLLARAASGLATATDPDRQLRLVLRRCRLQCIEIVPLSAGAAGTPRCKVRIQHWAGYGTKRTSFLGFTPRRTFVCPTCRRLHDAPLDGLDKRAADALA